ncbi:hypothetical protein AVEN_71957-1 [Araneus ventricosus]|uniref:Uncharacterized protein n=1 Tax=Araneus ventricosus TaxID=182803 RepID=A0A4Y2F523_ARAVE|nr:hypothetical protein AVEN_71957-1 [Araneus ventricosus]
MNTAEKRYYQDISGVERSYKGKWSLSILVEYYSNAMSEHIDKGFLAGVMLKFGEKSASHVHPTGRVAVMASGTGVWGGILSVFVQKFGKRAAS